MIDVKKAIDKAREMLIGGIDQHHGYLTLTENGFYITDHPEVEKSKTIWHSYYDQEHGRRVLTVAPEGIGGPVYIISDVLALYMEGVNYGADFIQPRDQDI